MTEQKEPLCERCNYPEKWHNSNGILHQFVQPAEQEDEIKLTNSGMKIIDELVVKEFERQANRQHKEKVQALKDRNAALEARIKELEKEQLTPIEAQFLLADYGGCGCKVCKGLVSKLKSIAKGDTK